MSTVFPASPSNGDTYIPPQIQKLLASDLANGDNFGWSVALSSDGTTALIGAIDEDSGNTDNGAAYVFTRSAGTWTEQAKLLASDRASSDFFGSSVALSSDGNTALIGAEGKDIFTDKDFGAAYVFTRTAGTWTQQQKLVVLDNNTDEFFGNSVALSSDGNTALIAAEGDDTSRGAAYIFTRSGGTWTEQQRLTAIGRANSDFFGWSVALSSDGLTALIGAIGEDTSPNTNNGAAYVFTLTGGVWTQQQELLASDRSSFDNFGISVALSADGLTAIIGASGETTSPTSGQGAAYVFTRSAGTWTEQAKLLASDRATDDDFGHSVAISADGNTVIIGAYIEDTSPNTNNGAAYIFTRSGSTWTQKAKLIASERANSDQFGRSVSLSSDGLTAIVGAWLKDTSPNTDQGAAYIYNFNNIGTRYTYNSTDNRWEVDTSIPKKAPTTHLFTSSVSSWAIPTGAKAIHAVVIAGGGAGGNGGTGTSFAGGGGGGGGGMSIHTYNLISGYQTTAVITVGAGATSGTGGTSSFKLADSGSLGTLTASGGTSGGTGGTTSATAGTGGLGMFNGGAGGAGLDTGSNDSPATSTGARGGGSGGGNHTSSIGGNGNVAPLLWTTSTINPGAGGGGGFGSSTNFGTIGSPGNLYGGGGGGGGAGASGFGGAIGRAGAQGCVFLTVWYE
jgi:hypothetical protein